MESPCLAKILNILAKKPTCCHMPILSNETRVTPVEAVRALTQILSPERSSLTQVPSSPGFSEQCTYIGICASDKRKMALGLTIGKPTQVDEEKILRPSGEGLLRN